jgi:hypothetical protein
MATAVVVNQTEFVDQMFAAAEKFGVKTRLNRNGDRQLDFDNKSLTEDHLRRLFQDIVNKMGVYTRADMDALLNESRPCAIAPFLELAVKAGLATETEEGSKKIYRFRLFYRVS